MCFVRKSRDVNKCEFRERCYVAQVSANSRCRTASCGESDGCTQYTYNIQPDDTQGCANPINFEPECPTFGNKCVVFSFTGPCEKNAKKEYEEEQWVSCYSFEDQGRCQNNGRVDTDGEWSMLFDTNIPNLNQ